MLLKEYEKNTDLELHHSDSEGYVIKSKKTGLIYNILEMVSYGSSLSSDMVMISIANENEGYIGMLDYIYADVPDKGVVLDFCLDTINDFEKGLKTQLDITGVAEGTTSIAIGLIIKTIKKQKYNFIKYNFML